MKLPFVKHMTCAIMGKVPVETPLASIKFVADPSATPFETRNEYMASVTLHFRKVAEEAAEPHVMREASHAFAHMLYGEAIREIQDARQSLRMGDTARADSILRGLVEAMTA